MLNPVGNLDRELLFAQSSSNSHWFNSCKGGGKKNSVIIQGRREMCQHLHQMLKLPPPMAAVGLCVSPSVLRKNKRYPLEQGSEKT